MNAYAPTPPTPTGARLHPYTALFSSQNLFILPVTHEILHAPKKLYLAPGFCTQTALFSPYELLWYT